MMRRFFRIYKDILFIFVLFAVFLGVVFISYADNITVSITVEDTECTDGIDNDSDTLIDFGADPGCTSTLDNDETDPVLPQCSDGIDNDSDTNIDYPNDLGCDSASDDDESNDPPIGGGGGGGGSGGSSDKDSSLEYSGIALPNGLTFILINGVVVGTTSANQTASFIGDIEKVRRGTHTVSFYAIDSIGSYSDSISVSLRVDRRSKIVLSDIFIPPTVWIDKKEVQKGGKIVVTGETVPHASVVMVVQPGTSLTATTTANLAGVYSHSLITSALSEGLYDVIVTAITDSGKKSNEVVRSFLVGNETVVSTDSGCSRKADLNNDCVTDIVDFSIMMYWWLKPLTEDIIEMEKNDLNGDGKFTLIDLSIMAYYWTG